MNEKFQLAFNEFIHVGISLLLIIALVSILTGLVRAFIPQERLQKKFSKAGKYSGLMGALLGIPTPFCSASMVPVSMGMVEMGAPFSMVFSFLISAPLANFVVVGFIFGVFGWKITLLYFLIVFIGAILIGTLAGKTSLKNEVKRINFLGSNSSCIPQTNISEGASSIPIMLIDTNIQKQEISKQPMVFIAPLESNSYSTTVNITGVKMKEAVIFGWALFKRIIPYVLIGAIISAVSAVFVPDAWVEKYLGNDNPIAIPLAAAVGVPLYLRIEMAIPLLKVLIMKGMSMGAAMALLIGGTGASLPELAIISSMLKPKAVIAFTLSVLFLAIIGGGIFYFLF